MSQKWNLQDIRPTTPRPPRQSGANQSPTPVRTRPHDRPAPTQPLRSKPTSTETEDNQSESFNRLPSIGVVDGKKRKRGRIIIGVLSCLVIIGASFGVSLTTSGTTITIFPKHRTLTVNAEFTAYKERQPNELTYEILTLDATGERQVTATGKEEVTTQSEGMIDIFKTTPGAERLIKNTRFQTEDGKVFRIQESVVVPGAGTNSAGQSVPGRIQVQVFADEAGDTFNLPANTRFTIPGFAESNLTDLFNSMYATNPEAIAGGFAGPKFIIDETELQTARQSLQLELRNSLLEKITDSQPVGFTVFANSVAITYQELPPVQYGDSLVTIREQAILQVPLFKSDTFASFIAGETIVGYNRSEPVRISNTDSLNFSYVTATTAQATIANLESLTFKITGTPQIVWTYDATDIITNLAGKDWTAHTGILGQNPGIERTTIDIKPFWRNSFPDDTAKITITEVIATE